MPLLKIDAEILEGDLGAQLDEPRRSIREHLPKDASATVLNVPLAGRPSDIVGQQELGVVEHIEKFKPQLQPDSLGNPRVLGHNRIGVGDARSVEGIATDIAESAERGRDKRGGIKVIVPWSPAEIVQNSRVKNPDRPNLLRTVPARVVDKRIASERRKARVSHSDRETGLIGRDPADPPAVDQ